MQDSTKSGRRRLISAARAAFLSRTSLSVMLGIEFHLPSSQGRSGFGPAWLRNGRSFGWPGTKLRGKWPANYLIWYHCVEAPFTPDAFYRLADHPLCNTNSGGNMNLLLGFTVLAFHCHHDVTLAARHRCSSVRRILSLTEHASPAHALISASGATGRLFINIFSGRFLFLGLVAARFTTPIESFSVFNFLHWHLHLHSLPRRIHFTLDRASVPKAVRGLA